MTASNTNTPDDSSVHYAAIERQVPAWLKGASETTLHAVRKAQDKAPAWFETACQAHPKIAKALAEAHAQHRTHETAVSTLFQHLPDLETFATQRLREGIETRFGLDIDVTSTYLIDSRLISDQVDDARYAINQATRSLLQCALHNFDADATAAGGMDAPQALLKKSVVLDHRRFMGTIPLTNIVDIEPHAFAELCRTLDIGGEYHKLLHDIYFPGSNPDHEPPGLDEAVYDTLARAEESAFRQSLHFAFLKGDIGQALYTAALAASLEEPSPSSQAAISFSTLTLWGAELYGVTLIHLQQDGPEQPGGIALYKPDDAERPMQEFASLEALKLALRDTLLQTPTYLDNCFAEREKSSVLLKLKDRLTPYQWSTNGTKDRVPDPTATLDPIPHALRHSVLGTLVARKVDRHEQDIVFRATSTQIVDRRSALAHRNAILGDVLTTLNIAGFVVPGLGEVMLAVCVTQLAYEVYEGIESWSNDDKAQAHRYLMDVVENVATLAAWAAAGYVVKKGIGAVLEGFPDAPVREVPTVDTPSFIEELEEVELPGGQRRLWQPDIAAFAHDTLLPSDLVPDDNGIYTHAGRRWLVLDGTTYAIKENPSTGQHRLTHPSKPLSYEPPLRHNGAGAWLHPLEHPEQWQALALFRRAGHLTAQFDDAAAQLALRVSDTDEESLRRVLCESQRLPGPLQDTLSRFVLDRKLAMRSDLTSPSALQTEFDSQYRNLPRSTQPGARAISARYPQLPVPVVEEVLRGASQAEMLELEGGGVPLRIAEEIRLLQQQVRLNRAYEGLYLEGVRSWDTDCLVLHTLERLPGWPSDITLELEQRQHSPEQKASLAPGAAQHSIVSLRAGYFVKYSNNPNQILLAHGSLYEALFEVLTAAQREALGANTSQELKGLVQQQPLLPRDALRKVLDMQPIRPGFRSPMRLANGRIGYPLGGTRPRASSISRQSLLSTIRQIGLYTPLPRPAEQALALLESQHGTREAINDRLQLLLDQRNQLQSSLSSWQQLMLGSAEDLERLTNAVTQHWYNHAFNRAESVSPLRLEGVSLADFPLILPAFFTDTITELELVEALPRQFEGWHRHQPQLESLARQFANLRGLQVSRAYQPQAQPSPFQFSLPLIARQMPTLESLVLTNQNISLSSTDLDSLDGMPSLRHLDLSGNRLSEGFPPAFNHLRLDYLGLDNMELERWPSGLGVEAVSRIGHISLRHNQIRVLPRLLLDNQIGVAEHAQLSFQGNPLYESDMLHVLLSESDRASRFEMDQTAEFRTDLAQRLERRQQLRDSIDNYVNASSSTATVSQAVMTTRLRIASALTSFWHDQEIGLTRSSLRLEGVSLEHFPRRLPAFFVERVHNLTLENVSGSSEQLSGLLDRFNQLTRLTIDNYQQAQASIPAALSHLPDLNELVLRDCQLEIDQLLLYRLERQSNLEALNLSGNTLGEVTTVPEALQSLRRLDLGNMGLRQWPAWVDSLLPLEMLDLSENQLTDLPEHILANLENDLPISSILLYNNPLTEDAVHRARTSSDSQRSFSFALDDSDISDDSEGFGHLHAPSLDMLDDRPNLPDWLMASEAENEALRDCWESLEEAGTAGDLLLLIGRVKNSATYQNAKNRRVLCERVRKVLVHALLNPDDLKLFNLQAQEALPQANGSQTCHDGALLVFKNLELRIANLRLQFDAQDTEANLYRELRRLFRLHALDELATRETGNRDEAEVRLTYLRELNDSLQLGLPPDNLRYAINASVDELTDAELQVQRGELGDDFLQFAEGNQRWVEHLRQTYAARFSEIESTYQAQVNALPDLYPDKSLEDLSDEFAALEKSKQVRESHLIRELTTFANPDRKPRSSSE